MQWCMFLFEGIADSVRLLYWRGTRHDVHSRTSLFTIGNDFLNLEISGNLIEEL